VTQFLPGPLTAGINPLKQGPFGLLFKDLQDKKINSKLQETQISAFLNSISRLVFNP